MPEAPLTDENDYTLAVGDRVRFEPYKRAMTVRAVTTGGRFAILTMPFAAQRTVIYTVIDFQRGVRGCDDHYGLGYETDEQVTRALEAFQATEDDLPGQRAREAEARGEKSWPSVLAAEVSRRKYVPLDIVTVLTTPPAPTTPTATDDGAHGEGLCHEIMPAGRHHGPDRCRLERGHEGWHSGELGASWDAR